MASQPTRTFFLTLNPMLSPFTREKREGFTNVQMSNGMWFNTRAILKTSKMIQIESARSVEKYINDLIIAESRTLQKFWFSNIPKYFNRRSMGMYYYRGGRAGILGSARRFRGQYSNRQAYPRRQPSGQLRRALTVRNKTIFGCELYVSPCITRSGRPVDYVGILMQGAKAGPYPYIPTLDKRINIPGKLWRGIPKSYWAIWQAVFEKQVAAANTRLNRRVEQYLLKMKVIEKSDIRRGIVTKPLKYLGIKTKTPAIAEVRREQLSRPQMTVFNPKAVSRWKDIYKQFRPRI